MFSERREGLAFLFPRTLRARLTVWNTLALVLLAIGIIVAIRSGLSYVCLREEDRLLADDCTEILAAARRNDWAELIERKAEISDHRKWFCRIITLDRTPVFETRVPEGLELPTTPILGGSSQEGYRVHQRRGERDGKPIVVIVGASLAEISEDVARLTRVTVVVAAAILVIAPFGGYWLAKRAVEPIGQMIETTERLRPSHLEERLPLRHTEDEMDRLASTINGFLDRIADHLERQNDLVADAAHELRSPLTAMRTAAEVTLQRDRSTAEYREQLEAQVEECERLGNLVRQLLLLAESDAGRLEAKNTVLAMRPILTASVSVLQPLAEAKNITLEMTTPTDAWIFADASRLRQVFHNLIDNAIKFTGPGGKITLAVEAGPLEQIRLTICDTGYGISASDLPFVGNRFFRSDRGRARNGGSGLGLSICRALVASMDATMAITSELGIGTTVCLTFHRAPKPVGSGLADS